MTFQSAILWISFLCNTPYYYTAAEQQLENTSLSGNNNNHLPPEQLLAFHKHQAAQASKRQRLQNNRIKQHRRAASSSPNTSWIQSGDGAYDCTSAPASDPCENVLGFNLLPMPPTCKQYMLCQDQKLSLMFSCAQGTAFDHLVKRCVSEELAECPCKTFSASDGVVAVQARSYEIANGITNDGISSGLADDQQDDSMTDSDGSSIVAATAEAPPRSHSAGKGGAGVTEEDGVPFTFVSAREYARNGDPKAKAGKTPKDEDSSSSKSAKVVKDAKTKKISSEDNAIFTKSGKLAKAEIISSSSKSGKSSKSVKTLKSLTSSKSAKNGLLAPPDDASAPEPNLPPTETTPGNPESPPPTTAAPTTKEPTVSPTASVGPTTSASPTGRPSTSTGPTTTSSPTSLPSISPSDSPTMSSSPTLLPSASPSTSSPTKKPTMKPTLEPTMQPTLKPTSKPALKPALKPTSNPTSKPTTATDKPIKKLDDCPPPIDSSNTYQDGDTVSIPSTDDPGVTFVHQCESSHTTRIDTCGDNIWGDGWILIATCESDDVVIVPPRPPSTPTTSSTTKKPSSVVVTSPSPTRRPNLANVAPEGCPPMYKANSNYAEGDLVSAPSYFNPDVHNAYECSPTEYDCNENEPPALNRAWEFLGACHDGGLTPLSTSAPTKLDTPPPTTAKTPPPTSPPETRTCISATETENFESGVFPNSLWKTGGDGAWEIDEGDTYEGRYSIKSPDLTEAPSFPAVSTATIATCDNYLGGTMTLGVKASVLPPADVFVIYVDGVKEMQLIDVNDWTSIRVDVPEGRHEIAFSYQYNVFNVIPLPPSPPNREGAVYIDDMRLTDITARSTLSKLGEKNNIQRKNGSGTLFGKNSSGTMFGLRYLGLISTFIPSLLLASLW